MVKKTHEEKCKVKTDSLSNNVSNIKLNKMFFKKKLPTLLNFLGKTTCTLDSESEIPAYWGTISSAVMCFYQYY